ncbi:hypothetical protein L7F22_007239 [Adiantum nelumboides]|nr:hypothetical protein [Adiantum nelumboides]
MSRSKIDALWKCMAFPSSVTERDIHLIFVAEEMESNAQPQIDWFCGRSDENRCDSVSVEATQEQDLPSSGNNFPLARLHDVLCDISADMRGDNPADQRPLHLKITS